MPVQEATEAVEVGFRLRRSKGQNIVRPSSAVGRMFSRSRRKRRKLGNGMEDPFQAWHADLGKALRGPAPFREPASQLRSGNSKLQKSCRESGHISRGKRA